VGGWNSNEIMGCSTEKHHTNEALPEVCNMLNGPKMFISYSSNVGI
jgi:hypothetical protein